jgi:hypothetical protein
VTSCCNAASSPGASQQSWCPPSLDVPSGNTLGSITHEATSARRRQIPRQPDSWLVSTRITKSSTPRLRHRVPSASNSFLFSRRAIALHHHRRKSHHASGPPRFPSRCVRKCASSKAEMSSEFSPRAAVSGRYGVKRCPRHSRRFRTPKVVCAAWSFLRERLTPRPTTAKSHYRLLWSANFV